MSEIEAAQVAPTSGTSAQSPLTFDEKQHLLEEALPIAKENIKGYETSELLTPEEREDVNRAGRQLRRGDNQIVFEAIPGIVDGTARYINGVAKITVDTEASGLFNPDNTVNMPVLENILAHEAIHIDDNRWFGLDSGPTTMAQSRRTERNAYRTGVAIDKANGITNYVTDPSTRATVILTRETSTFAAERSVQKWVDAYNGSIPRYNLSADANNRANRDYNAWARKNGKAQVISYPRTPITYSPPKSYLASTDSYGNSR